MGWKLKWNFTIESYCFVSIKEICTSCEAVLVETTWNQLQCLLKVCLLVVMFYGRAAVASATVSHEQSFSHDVHPL